MTEQDQLIMKKMVCERIAKERVQASNWDFEALCILVIIFATLSWVYRDAGHGLAIAVPFLFVPISAVTLIFYYLVRNDWLYARYYEQEMKLRL
jgi:hypothetical protein